MDRVNAIAEIAVDTQKALSSSYQNGSRLFFLHRIDSYKLVCYI